MVNTTVALDDEDVPELVDVAGSYDHPESMPLKRVPITIVTGYLGSGKSTLLNYVATQKEKKIAMIMNEFGSTADIERALTVRDGQSIYEEWLELDNGCLCCTVKDNGVAAIEKLMEKSGKFDYILLETSGVADPGPIANMFWLDDALLSSIYLDGIITVLDAENIVKSLEDVTEDDQSKRGQKSKAEEVLPRISTASIQIAHADVIILNKCDRFVTRPSDLEAIKARISSINSIAPIVESTYGKVDLSKILDLRAYDGTIDNARLSSSKELANGWHDHRIATIALGFDKTTQEQEEKIESWLQHVLWEYDIDGTVVEIHRTKGRLMRDDNSRQTRIIQGVRDTYDIVDLEGESPLTVDDLDMNYGKLVLIGKNISYELVSKSFSDYVDITVKQI
ncbi:hypothetical protein AWJ20_3632 [Sugiyamaella lignohabitans]|uniref:CobW/HypB/UreG nucleotide-binding domain-containing protein n=1 Tax=Sugiyamaella lignohabitans TaxID=796027 RepID=A0A170QYK8_9ASCO|nr:uncharacterized protein AWJ20_3632 [Sugiyamaella lignohabitans]ANB15983.1 hypothetical protein AWJ20_3632 [Sugiyamaella lignohabitans]